MFQVYKQTKKLFIKSFVHYMAWEKSPQWWEIQLTPEQKKEEIAEEKALLKKMVEDGRLNGDDLQRLEKIEKNWIANQTKEYLKEIWKEILEQSGFEIHTQADFDFFQRVYQHTYQKESGILWWENGKVKVKNEDWKEIYQTVSSLLVWENGNIYIFVSATSTNTSTVIEDGVLKKQKTSKTNGIWLWENDNEINKNILRKAEITKIYEEYLKELEKIYQAYELIDAIWKNKIKEILENVKNNKKWFIEYQTNSNQTIDKIKTNFEQKIKIMKDHFETNNLRSVEAVNNSQETPAAAEAPAAEAEFTEKTPLSLENQINIKHAWVKQQIETYKTINPKFDYTKPTLDDIRLILEEYKNDNFSKKDNIPENSALIIFAIQCAIKELGKWAKLGNIDGQFWQKTKETLNELQESVLWFTWTDVDGIPWQKTIQAIIEKLNAST